MSKLQEIFLWRSVYFSMPKWQKKNPVGLVRLACSPLGSRPKPHGSPPPGKHTGPRENRCSVKPRVGRIPAFPRRPDLGIRPGLCGVESDPTCEEQEQRQSQRNACAWRASASGDGGGVNGTDTGFRSPSSISSDSRLLTGILLAPCLN
jgi:hypothetical protein